MVHAQFEATHAFRNGSCSVDSAPDHTILVRRRLTRAAALLISSARLTRSDDYVAAVSSWVRTFLLAAIKTVELAEVFVTELVELRNEFRRLRGQLALHKADTPSRKALPGS